MAENIKIFRGGGLNTDDAVEFVAQNDYIEAYNLRVIGTSQGEEGLATNPESNVLISNTLASGLNKAIGAAGFEVNRTAYSFIYNSQLFHVIAKLDYDANTQTNIYTNLTNSGGQSILPLNPEYYVNDIKLVNDFLLAWTDGNGQPCIINIKRLESGGYATLTQEDFLIIKGQPMVVPSVEFANDGTRSANFLKNFLFQFMYQYEYLDNEFSAYSIMSKRVVPEDESTGVDGTNVSINNTLVVGVNIGTDRVKTLNIVARIGLQDFFTIRTVDRAAILALPNTAISIASEIREAYNPATNMYYFCFYNDGIYSNVDPIVTDLPYDFVPLKCETLESVNGNVLALGGITEGYERPVTNVLLEAVTYNPNIFIVPEDPLLSLRVQNWSQTRIDSYRKVTIYYAGIAQEGDQFKIVTSTIEGVPYNPPMTYTVTSGQDGNTEAAVRAFAATMPYPTSVTVFSGLVILTFTTRRESETPDGNREQALIVNVQLALAGTGQSISKPALKSNSSYQAFLWYKDKWGRYFPICTDERYIVKTPSYSQIQGSASMISWKINHQPPADAAYYGWGLSYNNTHQTTLWTQGLIDAAASNATYFVFNINPLLKFNQANLSSILSYEYSVGDRCTFVYYNTGDDTSTKTWLDKIDVEVTDFKIDVNETDPTIINYILTVRKPASISEATLTGNNILLEIYTPKKRINSTGGYAEQLMYEIGISYPIVNGAHTVTTGTIKEGDVYIKSRQMADGADLNQLDSLVVEDFNFSDFYPSAFASYGKPRTYNDERGRVERKASIRYSDTFQRDSLTNGLTRFYGENIYGDADGETSSNYGWIRKIRQRNNVLVVLQELKVGYVPVYQAIVEDQQESSQYAISSKIFNYVRYNGKNIGMGNAKESYAEWNNNIYFVDPFRSEPIRAGLDGVDAISGKMSKFFKETLQKAYEQGKKLIGYYDIFYNEYIISTETEGDILVAAPFNVLNWQLDDTYVIPASGISITTNGTKGVATYNSTTGIATYVPNNGQTGADSFTFSFTPTGGSLTTKKVCLTIEEGNTCGDLFDFAAVSDATLSTVYVSNQILVSGINIPAPISITGGEYRIDGGSWTSTSGTVSDGSGVEVRVTSSALEETAVSTTLTIGCNSATFTVTTGALVPDCNCVTFVNETAGEATITYISCETELSVTEELSANSEFTRCVDTNQPIDYPEFVTITIDGTCTTDASCEIPVSTEYRLFGYADDTSDSCGQTGSYTDLGTLTVYAASPTPSGVTLFYNNTAPLANPYINGAIGNGDRILFALASNTSDKWTGTYNNTTGAISSNVDCTP